MDGKEGERKKNEEGMKICRKEGKVENQCSNEIWIPYPTPDTMLCGLS